MIHRLLPGSRARVVLASIASALAGLLAVMNLAGWVFHSELLTKIVPGAVAMNPATAMLILLSAGSIVLMSRRERAHAQMFCARALAMLVLLVACYRLLAYLCHWNIGPDTLLFADQLLSGTGWRNQMSPNTALSFMLLGLALLLAGADTRRSIALARGLAIAGAVMPMAVLIEYARPATAAIDAGFFIPMAATTAIALLCLCTSLWILPASRPGQPTGAAKPLSDSSSDEPKPTASRWIGLVQRAPLEQKVLIALGSAVLLTWLIGLISYQSINAFVVAARWDDHTRQVMLAVTDLRAMIKDAELSTRAYVLSGSQEDLRPYRDSSATVMPQIARLRALTADNLSHQKRLDHLEPSVRQLFADDLRTQRLRDTAGIDAARRWVTGPGHLQLFDGAKQIVSAMLQEESSLLKPRTLRFEAVARQALAAIYFGLGFALVLVAAVAWVIFSDIGTRRRMNQALHDRERQYRSLADAMPQIVWKVAPEGNIEYCNRRTRDYLQVDITSMTPAQRTQVVHPDDRHIYIERIQRPQMNPAPGIDFLEGEYRLRRGSDGAYRWHLARTVIQRDEEGNLLGWIGTATDIHDQKLAEQNIQRLNEALQAHGRQLEASNQELEAFSYSVSHDLRAPLRGIDGFSQALLEDHGPNMPEEARDHLSRIRNAAQRMAQLIDDLLNLSRITRAELCHEPIDLSIIGGAVVADLRRADPQRQIEIRIPESLPARGDVRLMGVVMTNLVGNAWKFTSKTAQPRIELGFQQSLQETIYFVRDNGMGFDMKYAGKLFGAFQRLHAQSEFPGTGIGLATVRRIINRHGGRIWVESEPGKGATFFFTLAPPTKNSLLRAA
jgi:PAS domain S-box-containing protein